MASELNEPRTRLSYCWNCQDVTDWLMERGKACLLWRCLMCGRLMDVELPDGQSDCVTSN
jgi:hypothetical protein